MNAPCAEAARRLKAAVRKTAACEPDLIYILAIRRGIGVAGRENGAL